MKKNLNVRAGIAGACVALLLSGCSTPQGAEPPAPTTEGTAPPAGSAPSTASSSDASADQATGMPSKSAGKTYTTPDGTLSFTHPDTWHVTSDPATPHSYRILDGDGAVRARLNDKVEALPMASVAAGFDSGYSQPVPGLGGAGGSQFHLVVHGSPGQAVGGGATIYAIKADADTGPIGRAAIEIPGGGYYVTFGGSVPLTTADGGDQASLVRAAAAYSNTAEFRETASVITSLVLDPAKIAPVGCIGARYRYDKLNGIGCDEAKATLDRVEKTGTPTGARNQETHDFLCFHASYGERNAGQADVICRSKATPAGISFQAWLKQADSRSGS